MFNYSFKISAILKGISTELMWCYIFISYLQYIILHLLRYQLLKRLRRKIFKWEFILVSEKTAFGLLHLIKNYTASKSAALLATNVTCVCRCDVTCAVHLPASEFRGQLGEEVGGCPGASMGKRAGVMVGQGGWSGWGWVDGGPTVPQLSPVKGAADCWASGQAAPVRRGRGGGSSGPRNAERGGRRCRHAVAQGAAEKKQMIEF